MRFYEILWGFLLGNLHITFARRNHIRQYNVKCYFFACMNFRNWLHAQNDDQFFLIHKHKLARWWYILANLSILQKFANAVLVEDFLAALSRYQAFNATFSKNKRFMAAYNYDNGVIKSFKNLVFILFKY